MCLLAVGNVDTDIVGLRQQNIRFFVRQYLILKSRPPYWISFWKLIKGLVALTPLATPMVVETKCMSLSQIQKALWTFE